MPKETAMYQQLVKRHYEHSDGIEKEVIRSATQDEFNKFMKLHDSSLYPSAQDINDELTLAIKENFDIKNKNNLTLTRVDIDTADGRHHVVFELASKINDYHTVAVHDGEGLILRDAGIGGYKQGIYINHEVGESTAKLNLVDEGGNERNILDILYPSRDTKNIDSYWFGGPDNGDTKLVDLFDIDQNPSSIKILHDVVQDDGGMLIG